MALRHEERFDARSNESLVYSRVVEVSELAWACAATREEQADLDERLRFVAEGTLDHRRPNHRWEQQTWTAEYKWVDCEDATLDPATHYVAEIDEVRKRKRMGERRTTTARNEHDGLAFGELVFVLGAPTVRQQLHARRGQPNPQPQP